MPTFPDQTLIPSSAIRLAALGSLAESPKRYGELAVEVRAFASRMLGPSLDILGTSIELLRHEGLIAGMGPRGAPGQSLTADTTVEITANGRAELRSLLTARVRAPMTDLSRLVVALKLRFLHLLDAEAQRNQLDMLADATTADLARLRDLRAQRPAAGDPLGDWLDQEIGQTEAKLAWYRGRMSVPHA